MSLNIYVSCERCHVGIYMGNYGHVGHRSDSFEVSEFIQKHTEPDSNCRLITFSENSDIIDRLTKLRSPKTQKEKEQQKQFIFWLRKLGHNSDADAFLEDCTTSPELLLED